MQIKMLSGSILYMEALESDKMLEAEFTQRDTFTRILPSGPRKVLFEVSARLLKYRSLQNSPGLDNRID